jgi:DNA-binding PadR family transcriptional regulator
VAAAACGAGDFDLSLFEMLKFANARVSEVRRGVHAMSGFGRGGPWDRDPRDGDPRNREGRGGRSRTRPGPGHWGGGAGPGGAWGGFWPGGPGGPDPARGTPKAARGDVRAAILALLREGPRNGYQIMADIRERSGGAWRPSPGAVYPALSALADEGLIAGEESGGRRTFSLTEAGQAYVAEHPDKARGAWESEEQQEAWQVPGLFTEAARLGGGIVQIARVGTPEQVRAAERLLEETRRGLYRILAEDADPDADDDAETDETDDQDM